jgi:hypothetical protein
MNPMFLEFCDSVLAKPILAEAIAINIRKFASTQTKGGIDDT